MATGQHFSFGALLRRLREEACLTQEQLAEHAGMSTKGVSALERGERQRPHPRTIAALADALRLDASQRASLVAVSRSSDSTRPSAPTASAAFLAPLTPLLGRERDVVALRALLLDRNVRLVTLLGPGGVGKTRLTQAVAADLLDQFADGAIFVALAALNDPALVVPTVAAALNVHELAGQSVGAILHAYLRDKHLLLVLDNFEHVASAAVEIATLLAACPRLTVLATSRAPLRVRGEQEYPVAPLPVPALDYLPDVDAVAASPAAELFVERAQAVAPAFALTQANAATIAAICRRLDGLPLALELAAARIKLISPVALLARLDRVLPLLAAGAQDLPERHQTLRQTIAWSYDLLAAEEQQFFRRLAVFAGGWTLEAAEAVAQRPSSEPIRSNHQFRSRDAQSAALVFDGLQSLVDNSLVAHDDTDEERWGMLETIRAYGLEQLETNDELDQARHDHATYFLELAREAEPELSRADQALWLDRLEQEHDNLRAALAWMLACGHVEDVVRMGWAIRRFWSIRGHISEGQRWMEVALEAETGLSEAAHAQALAVLGTLAYQQHNPDRAARLLEESTARSGVSGTATRAYALLLRGFVAIDQAAYSEAAGYFTQALEQCHALDDREGTGSSLTGRGYAALHLGNVAQAIDELTAGERELRAAGALWNLAVNLNMQAAIRQLQGDYVGTEALLRESLVLSQRLRDTWALPFSLEGLAHVALAVGQPLRAARLFGAAEPLREPLGNAIGNAAWRGVYSRQREALERLLDAQTLADEWAAGRALPIEQIVALALEAPSE